MAKPEENRHGGIQAEPIQQRLLVPHSLQDPTGNQKQHMKNHLILQYKPSCKLFIQEK